MVRAETLRVVIKVRQINEGQVGRPFERTKHFRSAAGDPLRGRQTRDRTPERMKRKWAQRLLEPIRQAVGCAENVKRLAAVGAVVRLGRDAGVNRRALVE